MKLSKYDILSHARLAFDVSFKCNKKQLTHFTKLYDNIIESNGSYHIATDLKSFASAKNELGIIFGLIKNNAKTEWNDTVSVMISFPENISNIYHINALKLILSFDDEELLYKLFPDRKNRIGSRSVVSIIKPDITKESVRNTLSNEHGVYGIDLSKIGNNMIIYNYIGGENYQDKFYEISLLIDKWIIFTYSTIENPEYTQEEVEKLSKLSKLGASIDDIFVSYDNFKNKFKNINILVDLHNIQGYENIYWASIKDRIKDIVKSTNMSENIEMTINYDSDAGKVQIKDSKLYAVSGLSNVDVIDSIISGDISNVSLYYTHVINTNANFCDFFTGCDVIKSKLDNCYIADGIEIVDSLISGDSLSSGGEFANCILNAGVKYTKYSKFKDCQNNATKI